jgi:CheY-like chemotaxis protein
VSRHILAVVSDLFFGTKISEMAKRVGVPIEFATTEGQVLTLVPKKPSLVLIDLNLGAVNPLQLIPRLKAHPDLSAATLIGFVSHVHVELRQQAKEAGCDQVLPRSALSSELPQILQKIFRAG